MIENEIAIQLIGAIKYFQKLKHQRDNLSAKMGKEGMDWGMKKRTKVSTDLNWLSMKLEEQRTNIARIFKGSHFDVETNEKEYNPSGWHNYKS